MSKHQFEELKPEAPKQQNPLLSWDKSLTPKDFHTDKTQSSAVVPPLEIGANFITTGIWNLQPEDKPHQVAPELLATFNKSLTDNLAKLATV